jgi:broad specificity phosphatase PhoE
MSDLQCAARFIVARHGEAEYERDRTGVEGGSLTTLGRAQARRLGEELRGERVAAVVSSSLSRAVQTGELAAGVLGVGMSVREGLQEVGVGAMHGRPFDPEVAEPVLRAWRRGDLGAAMPGGGESGAEACDRVLPVLESMADTFRGETVLVVSHGGVIQALLGRLSPDPDGSGDLRNCDRFLFEVDADGWRGPPVGIDPA